MPNIKSAAKNLRSSRKHRVRNRGRKAGLKKTEKDFLDSVEQKDVAKAQEALKLCFSRYDKAAKVGTIHLNKANRKKARLTAKLQTLVKAAAPAV